MYIPCEKVLELAHSRPPRGWRARRSSAGSAGWLYVLRHVQVAQQHLASAPSFGQSAGVVTEWRATGNWVSAWGTRGRRFSYLRLHALGCTPSPLRRSRTVRCAVCRMQFSKLPKPLPTGLLVWPLFSASYGETGCITLSMRVWRFKGCTRCVHVHVLSRQ